MIDAVIRGGTVLDGTGADPFVADIAVEAGRIAAVGPNLSVRAREEIDAEGLLVTPGFLDVHTHYDGQVTWDETLLPSSAHGVTTAVIGCCGIGFAPVRPGTEDWLIRLTEGVEDIPGSALHVGIPWGWESYPEYLDVLAKRRFALDIAAQIPHSALRAYVLKERAVADEPATPAELAELAEMAAIVRASITAGAIGIGTSRVLMHRGSDGGLLPGTLAAEEELMVLGEAMREAGGGIFQIVPSGSGGGVEGTEGSALFAGDGRRDRWTLSNEVRMMRRLHRRTGGPVTFSLSENRGLGREEFERARDAVAEAVDAGDSIYPQFSPRPIGSLSSLESYHVFMARPTYLKLAKLPLHERVTRMRDPGIKAAILAEADVPTAPGDPMRLFHVTLRNNLADIYTLDEDCDFEPEPASSVLGRARASGREPLEVLYDLLLEKHGKAVLVWMATNYLNGDLSLTEDILRDPRYIVGLGDAGAHVRVICDASYTTFLLTHWARDRKRGPRLPLPYLIRKLTYDPAALYGFHDRGTLAPGKRADLNVIDFDALTPGYPYLTSDLPSGAQRFLQQSRGYALTMVAGVATRRGDTDTAARPGRLLRARHAS
jgi:N-acyl-D-aspartate/D-glutamate deacylase